MATALMINDNFLMKTKEKTKMEKTKLMKSAAVIDRILKILQGFAMAFAIVAAIFIPLTAIFGEKIVADSSRIDIGNLNIKLAGESSDYLNAATLKGSIIATLVSAIIVLAVIWYCLRVLRGIMADMKEGRPFEQGISAKIKKLAWTVLIGGAIAEIGRAVGKIAELKSYNISALFANPPVESTSFNYSINLWFIAAAVFLFFLSYVFKYGEGLQKESDETL